MTNLLLSFFDDINKYMDNLANENITLFIIYCVIFAIIFVFLLFYLLGTILTIVEKRKPKGLINNIKSNKNGIITPISEAPIEQFTVNEASDRNYYRYQPDRQEVIERTPEQKKIFDEYFVIKNFKFTNKPLLIASLVSFLISIILTIIFVKKDNIALLISGIVCFVLFLILLVLYIKKIAYLPLKVMTDEEYEKLVNKKIESLNLKKLGAERLNIDLEQIKEIEPIILKDKVLDKTSLRVYNPKDKSIHSSTQNVIVIYFTDEQLLAYKIQFDMCCNAKKEWTSEFFYQDVCDVSSYEYSNIYLVNNIRFDVNELKFEIISTNSSIGFVMNGAPSSNQSIQAMKQKIRDKKN